MERLPGIQALRGLAAIAVAFVHVASEVASGSLAGKPGTAIFALLPWEAGVDVFFVISGFVMAYASGPLFGRPGATRIFLARRVARVVPLYWLTTTAVLAVLLVRPDLMRSAVATPGLVVASYGFVPIARPDGIVQPVYSLGWTLNYEMFFYALFAVAIAWPRRQAVLGAVAALCGLVALGFAFRPLPPPLGLWTSPPLLEFAFGLGLGLARAEGAVLGRPVRWALALGGFAFLLHVGRNGPAATGIEPALLFGIPAACLVAAVGLAPAGRDDGAGWPARAAEALGDASYAVYLLHPFVIRLASRVLDAAGLGPALGVPGFTLVALAGSVAVGWAVFRVVERPLTRSARRALQPGSGRHTARDPPPSSS